MRSPIVPNGQPGPHDIPNLWTVPFPCALIVFSVGDRRHQRQPSAPSSSSPSSVSRSRLNWQIPSQSCGTRHINLANPFALVIQPDRQRHALPIGDHLHRPGHRDWQVGNSARGSPRRSCRRPHQPDHRRRDGSGCCVASVAGGDGWKVVLRLDPRSGGVAPIPARLEPHVAGSRHHRCFHVSCRALQP